jgi:hypothetical protein
MNVDMKNQLDILPDATRLAMDRAIRCLVRAAPNYEAEIRKVIPGLVMTAFYDGILEAKNT